jgi:hypothetical protein
MAQNTLDEQWTKHLFDPRSIEKHALSQPRLLHERAGGRP